MTDQIKTNKKDQHILYWAVFILTAFFMLNFVVDEIYRTYYFSVEFTTGEAATSPTLSLNPSSAGVINGQTLTMVVFLDTAGRLVDGVDIYSLHFNPSILQVVDDNTSVTGIQITPGSLFPVTVYNTADNSNGTIRFSQASSGGTNFSSSGTLATIHFRAAATGTSAVTIDFTAGSTTDSNVAVQGTDVLAVVNNSSVTVTNPDLTPPSVSITAPSAGATVFGSNVTVSASATDNIGVAGVQFKLDGANLGIEDTSAPYSISWNASTVANGTHTLSATARDPSGNTANAANISVTVNNPDLTAPSVSITAPSAGANVSGSSVTVSANATDNIGVAGVQFKLDGANLGIEDTSAPYSISWNASTASAGAHSLTAVARDAAGNTATSSAVSVTVIIPTITFSIQLDLEALPNDAISGALEILNSAKALLASANFTSSSTGTAGVTVSNVSAQTGYVKLFISPFLSRVYSVSLANGITVTIPKLLTGDLNHDNLINSIDYSVLNTNWFTSSATPDLNKDGLVNSIDFSYMNKNWLLAGEQ